jgi:hypothetical protein
MSPIVFLVPATEVQITVDEIIGNLTMNQQVELLVKLSNLLANNYVLNPKRLAYSKTHQRFSTRLQNPEALTNPEKYLGKNYSAVLEFWWTMDSLTETQWNEVARRYDALDSAAWSAAWYAAGDAAVSAAGYTARNAAGYAAVSAASSAAWYAAGYAAMDATYELIGGIENPVFVPLFEGFVAG